MLNLMLIADMMRWGEGGWFWMGLMMVFWVLVAIVVVFFLARAFSPHGSWGREEKEKAPLDIAKRRYASGEISGEEFEKIRRDLKGG